ncbi:MAG: hypothetical protein COU40_01040 [Candidatus Moranbacteria bacterium CG10_big_fil_rev_8_21_14_0_10_35_21]|nr:MAG: hypothetical protein COU40_01040 [Candidatus Moranbacteria bacterium CG10_big_fil_rev_8_21_14_0_10_35_21]PJA88683.1 MAG: hypothetical protein CO139_01825 [Candidatus Moranbacteria bacterium CG_4_9_14_3_um_filter_36_9]
MWNPFKKNNPADPQKMGMLQKIAMKKLANMSDVEKQKIAQEAFKPENRDKMLKVMEQMKASGQITEEQFQIAKNKMN